ncbi:NYN domain-containing protein [Schizophyllum commune]
MTGPASVGIFWDFENCRYSAGRSGYEIARAIEQIALEYGTVSDFNAYLDMQFCALPAGMRSELQSSGVALVDCPHNGQKDVVDQMLQTDMLAYALDHPAPATLILISGDRDFAYTVSVLRRRRYEVVLLCHSRPGPHKSLAWQVSACLDWNTRVLGLPEDPLRKEWSRSSSSTIVSTTTSQTDDSFSKRDDTPSTPSGSSVSLSSWSSPPTSPSNESTDLADKCTSEDTESLCPSPDTRCETATSSVAAAAERTATTSAVVLAKDGAHGVFEPLIRLLQEQSDAGFSQPNRGVIGYRLAHHFPGVYEKAGVKSFTEYAMRACQAGLVTLGGAATGGGETWIALTKDFDSPSPLPPPSSSPLLLSSPSPAPASSTWSAFLAANPSTPSSSTFRPASVFKPLVRVLTALREVGETRPRRSLVGNALLATCPDAYAKAGVSRFKQYVDAAEQAGVVVLGGEDGDAWLALPAEGAKRVTIAETPVAPTPTSAASTIQSASKLSYSKMAMTNVPAWVTGTEMSTPAPASPSPTPKVTPSTPVSSPTNASQGSASFKPLMRVLRQLKAEGQDRPLYSVVGSSLKAKDPEVYKKAAVSGLAAYVSAANAAGLVTMGGTKGGAEWVSIASVKAAPPATTQWAFGTVTPAPAPTPSFASVSTSAASIPSTVPAEYRLLVQILQEQKQAGKLRPLRSYVGEQLIKRDPNICKRVQTSSSAEYMARAASVGLVTLSGPNNGAEWISLGSTPSVKAPPPAVKPPPPTISAVPSQFRLLVRILHEYRETGQASPNRGLIGSALVQRDKGVYKKAGVENFREYVASAEKAGIVVLGGDPEGGHTWIALEKKWKKMVVI